MELLYIWIGDNPIDTLQQEFCFTPEYDIYLDTQNDALIIEKKNTLNIFKKDTILNIIPAKYIIKTIFIFSF